MREILFRGKRKDTHEWVMGGYCEEADSGRTYIAFWNSFGLGFLDFTEVYPKSVGQYTGLTDENGTKIFEGDIVQTMNDDIAIIQYDEEDAMFYMNDDNVLTNFGIVSPKWLEVIGNIHDNPELIGNI